MFGSNYVIDHVMAEHKLRASEMIYRVYTADMLKGIAEFCGCQVRARYSDLIKPQEELETGDEVALRVIKRLGLKGKQNESDRAGSETDS